MITKDLTEQIVLDLRAAVDAIAAKHGLRAQSTKATYDTLNGTIRLPVMLTTGQTDADDATRLGLPADIVGRTFTLKGVVYRVTGLNPRKPKFCVEAERLHDHRRLSFPVAVKNYLL